MPQHSHLLGLAALLAAAVLLPAQAQAEHESRYFGFSYQPYPHYPPVAYPPPPRVRQLAPGVYEYEVAPGRWVRMRSGSGYGYQPPRRSIRRPPPSWQARPEAAPPPVPKSKPDPADEPSVAARDAPATVTMERIPEERIREERVREEPMQEQAAPQAPEQTAARSPEQTATSLGGISCEAAADIVKGFGFSDVTTTSCSGDTYRFDASRDGSSYSIRLSAANGELTEVRKR
jgi:hypothetical protein